MTGAPKRPKKMLSEEAKKKRRESKGVSKETDRVDIGQAFTCGRELRESVGSKLDAEREMLLLD